MRSYPQYRDSGVEWLGEVPEQWESGPLQRWFAIVNGGTPASSEETYWDGDTVWLTPDDLGQNKGAWISAGRRTITEEGVRNSSARVTPAGSIVLSTRAPIGHLAITGVPAATNQGCRTLVPSSEADSCFAYYALLASRAVLQSLGKGSTFMELTPTDLGGHVLPLPPLDEQRAIAAYLDRETERIDALVSKKRLLIERLEEYRTALITRTVTRGLPPEAARAAGLDPSPRLKPSGVEWLGDMPEHWEVGNIRRYAEMKSGHTPSRQHPEYWEDCDIPWFTLSDVWQLRDGRATYLGETRELISDVGVANSAAELLPTGTVILSRTASIGFSGVMPMPMATSQDFWNWVCGPKLMPLYLLLTFRSMRNEFNRLMMGSTHRTIYEASAASFRIPVPPTPEQQAIIEFLEERLPSNDAARDAATLAIERLQEYRAALITAAVTGKIDVRE